MKSIVSLENKPESLKKRLEWIENSVNIEQYFFNFITDDRAMRYADQYDKISNILSDSNLKCTLIRSSLIIKYFNEKYFLSDSAKQFIHNYPFSLKLLTIGFFSDLVEKFLYCDDDCVFISDPEKLFDHEYAITRYGLNHLENDDILLNSINESLSTNYSYEEYNDHIVNAGIILMSKNINYNTCLIKYLNSEAIQFSVEKKRYATLDERFLGPFLYKNGTHYFKTCEIRLLSVKDDLQKRYLKLPKMMHIYKGLDIFLDKYYMSEDKTKLLNKDFYAKE